MLDKIIFITGNKNKFNEAKAILENIEQLDIKLPEIQDIDPEIIIRHKLKAAFSFHKGPFIVEDVSLSLDCLNGLPGPLIKWFLASIKAEGIYNIAKNFNNTKAVVTAIYGFAQNKQKINYFIGKINGTIVKPKVESGFGFDFIFQPDGYSKSFGEMTFEEKNQISHRKIALEKLKNYLNRY